MKKLLLIFAAIFFVFNLNTIAQEPLRSDPNLRVIGYHTGNRVGLSFYNDSQIAGFNVGTDIRGEWPLGSAENYIGDCIPLIGVELVNSKDDTLHSVVISRGPREGQSDETHPTKGYFRGWNPTPGFRNPGYESVAMSHIPESWPPQGWNDTTAIDWQDEDGNTQWFGYFGRGVINANQESLFEADDHWDDEFNGVDSVTGYATTFVPDTTDSTRHGMGLRLRQRGFQWSSFLAEDVIFWLYNITNDGTYNYRKANFGTIVGTLAGGDGDSQDDRATFDIDDWITYSYDSDGIGNIGQKVGYVGYAFLESPGNPFDGIDNDGDSRDQSVPTFSESDFEAITFEVGEKVVLIEEGSYKREVYTIQSLPDTVFSLGKRFIIKSGKEFREGHIEGIDNFGVWIPSESANDGIDNDLDGLIDENEITHFFTRNEQGLPALKYVDYRDSVGTNDLLIDERRDNDIDEDRDWSRDANGNFVYLELESGEEILRDDVGEDGLGPYDTDYPGPDFGENDGVSTQGEPNFGKTDPDESDQIGLTGFDFFEIEDSPDLSNDELVWSRMVPGRFDSIKSAPMDGDFIYSSGYFPLTSGQTERFSTAFVFGEDRQDVLRNKETVQDIYDADYTFPKAPKKPEINITQDDGDVVIYWDGGPTENDIDFVTKKKDFQGYKIYRATDANFRDSRKITNAFGVLSFDKPMTYTDATGEETRAQFDLKDTVRGFYYPSESQLEAFGGTSYYLGSNTGIINKFVDSTAIPGQTYYYAVVAYDSGEESVVGGDREGIFPEENSKFIFKTQTGEIVTDDNTGYITPSRRPAGYDQAKSSELTKSEGFIGTGEGYVNVVDESRVKNNHNYKVTFKDTSYFTDTPTFSDTLITRTDSWSLIDLETPDTVYIPTINETILVNPNDSVNVSNADTILVNGEKYGTTGDLYYAGYDSLIVNQSNFFGRTPVRDGFRVQLYNDPFVNNDSSKSGFVEEVEDSLFLNFSFRDPAIGIAYPSDYAIEFFKENVDTSTEISLEGFTLPAQEVNFKIKNVTTGEYIDFAYWETGNFAKTFNVLFIEDIKDKKDLFTWKLELNYVTTDVDLFQDGTLELKTIKPFNSRDEFYFTTTGASIDKEQAKADMEKIKVVPNPYVVTHKAEAQISSFKTSGRGEREIRFTYIPPDSKISIYTVRGELIKTLRHNDTFTGSVYWNLRTDENLDVAYGVYIYVVETPGVGKKIGKFALIK